MVQFDSDNLVYNRFDIIYSGCVEKILSEYKGETYAIDVYYEKPKAAINVWGKSFPQEVFDKTIEGIFRKHEEIKCVELNRAGNDYKKLLNMTNDIYIPIPDTIEQLLHRLNKKHRYTLKRLRRLLEDRYGSLEVEFYQSEIPDYIVNLYFDWKKISHGRNYHMTPKEYLEKYYVTDAMLLRAGEVQVGVIFFCMVEDTAYLENLSYDAELEKYSPGYLTYELLLEELVRRKASFLYLGGGKYAYKKRFGAEEKAVYSGIIYRKEVFDEINYYLSQNGIREIAIYGLGACGMAFLRLAKYLNLKVSYGIDKEKKEIDNLQVYSLMDGFPKVDAVFITLKNRNGEVENYLKNRFNRIYYWKNIVDNELNR